MQEPTAGTASMITIVQETEDGFFPKSLVAWLLPEQKGLSSRIKDSRPWKEGGDQFLQTHVCIRGGV